MKIVLNSFKIILSIIFVIIICFNLFIIMQSIIWEKEVPSFFGYKAYVTVSGSSQTDINYCDFVVICEDKNIELNDVVVVKTVDKKATTYSVKNINNDMLELEDETKDYVYLTKNSIEGVVKYKNSILGQFIMLLQNPMFISFILVITILVGIFIYKIMSYL